MDGRVIERTTIKIPVQFDQLVVTKPGLQELRRHLKSAISAIEKILLDNP